MEFQGKTALVTYIRTDSTRVSLDAQFMAKEYIVEKYGKEYHPGKFNEFNFSWNLPLSDVTARRTGFVGLSDKEIRMVAYGSPSLDKESTKTPFTE